MGQCGSLVEELVDALVGPADQDQVVGVGGQEPTARVEHGVEVGDDLHLVDHGYRSIALSWASHTQRMRQRVSASRRHMSVRQRQRTVITVIITPPPNGHE